MTPGQTDSELIARARAAPSAFAGISTREVPPGTPGQLLPATFSKHVPGCAAP
jgi:hypothetical protein